MTDPRNIAANATMKQALVALDRAAAASFSLLGPSIDRQSQGFQSALFGVFAGTATGTPTSLTVDAKLQESSDDSTYTDVVADGVNTIVAVPQIVAVSTQKFLAVDLSRLKRFVRLAFTVAFVGGTTPKVYLDAKAMLGGGVATPPTHS